MPPVTELLAAFADVFTILGVGSLFAVLGVRTLRPEIRRLRSDPIDVYQAANADGRVELHGTVRPDEHTLKAPFTGIDCVAYRWAVEEYQTAGQNSHWKTLDHDGTFAPFRLEDDSGSILVHPEGDAFHFADEWTIEVGKDETVQGRPREFLESRDVEPGEAGEVSLGPIEWGTGDRRRYTEERLDVGDDVAVYGPVEYDPDAAREWGSGAVNAAVRPSEAGPVVVGDEGSIPLWRSSTAYGIVSASLGLLLVAYGVLQAIPRSGAIGL